MVVKECRTAIFINNMDISSNGAFPRNSQEMKEEKHKDRSREVKKARIGDDDFSHSTSDNRLILSSDKGFPVKVHLIITPMLKKDRVSNPKPQGGDGGGFSLSTCAKCVKKHEGKCLARADGCFGTGKSN